MPTILINGCRSGFGLAIAQRFVSGGWDVAATTRTQRNDLLTSNDRLEILPLDVTNSDSVAKTVEAAGPPLALVNHAGVGMPMCSSGRRFRRAVNCLRQTSLAVAVTKLVLPQMRVRRSGVIVNVSSTVTLRPLPALSVYTASKAALNAFAEILALEAALFGVRAIVVLLGLAPTTRFRKNAVSRMGMEIPERYEGFVQDYLSKIKFPH